MRLEINNKNKKAHKIQTCGGNIIYYQTDNGTVKRSKKNIQNIGDTKEDTMFQILWDTAKAILRGKFIAI